MVLSGRMNWGNLIGNSFSAADLQLKSEQPRTQHPEREQSGKEGNAHDFVAGVAVGAGVGEGVALGRGEGVGRRVFLFGIDHQWSWPRDLLATAGFLMRGFTEHQGDAVRRLPRTMRSAPVREDWILGAEPTA